MGAVFLIWGGRPGAAFSVFLANGSTGAIVPCSRGRRSGSRSMVGCSGGSGGGSSGDGVVGDGGGGGGDSC